MAVMTLDELLSHRLCTSAGRSAGCFVPDFLLSQCDGPGGLADALDCYAAALAEKCAADAAHEAARVRCVKALNGETNAANLARRAVQGAGLDLPVGTSVLTVSGILWLVDVRRDDGVTRVDCVRPAACSIPL